LGCFHVLDIVNNSAMSAERQTSPWDPDFHFFWEKYRCYWGTYFKNRIDKTWRTAMMAIKGHWIIKDVLMQCGRSFKSGCFLYCLLRARWS
jgi:hypothetical protein